MIQNNKTQEKQSQEISKHMSKHMSRNDAENKVKQNQKEGLLKKQNEYKVNFEFPDKPNACMQFEFKNLSFS